LKIKALWTAFWSKAGAVSVRTKIMGIVMLCVLSSGVGMIWLVQGEVSTALKSQLRERGIAIGTGLAVQSQDLVLTNNQFALYSLSRETLKADQDLAYVFVLDAEGNILVHTFEGGFPLDLLGVNIPPLGAEYQVETLQTEDGLIRDVVVPLLGGQAGVVRIGMSEARVAATVGQYVRDILVWMVLILVLGLSVAYVLASILTRPLARMVEASRAVSRGDFRWRAPVWAKDEIGRLGTAFNDMSQKLKRKEEMRTHLLAKVISAQEEERKRIARELHDETSQALTALMVGLKLIEDSPGSSAVRQKASELRATAAETLAGVHDLAVALRPGALDDIGLVAALHRYVRDFSAKLNIEVDSYMRSLEGRRLLPEVETAIYRIVQEALTNVAKHAQAKNVSMILECRGLSLVTIVEDDGKGFDVDTIMNLEREEKRLGIFGMMERASLIGGTLTIESQPGMGTTVFLEVPLELMEVLDEQDKAAFGR